MRDYYEYNRDREINKRVGKDLSLRVYGKNVIKDLKNEEGDSIGKAGGYTFATDCGSREGFILAEGRRSAKKGIDGAKIACEAFALLIESYNKIYKREEDFINAISSECFSKNLSALWKEMVVVYHKDEAERKKEAEKPSFFGGFFKRVIEEVEEDSAETAPVSPDELIKDYATSVSIAVVTESYYILGSIGQGSFVLCNEYEGKKAFGSTSTSAGILLGDGIIKLGFERHAKNEYGTLLMLSDKLGCLLSDEKSLYKYANQLDKELSRINMIRNPFSFTENDGIATDLLKACSEHGASLILVKDTRFKLSEEKERAYKEEIARRRKEESEKKRQEELAKNLELAKDKSLYVTYDYSVYEEFDTVQIFSARRQGKSHLSSNTPCQDYCASAYIPGALILTDADGVGSCPKSEIGSRLACEAVIDVITRMNEQCENEEQFATRLQNIVLRERIISDWRTAVYKHATAENPDKKVDYNDYATTLMFAVITKNYYVVGCIGDGQVLLFNDSEAVKLRFHSPKSDSKTNAVSGINCFREDFFVEKFNRSDFSSVLLTTDGIYDPLARGELLYQYAKQAKARFIEREEPYQPFCFQPDGDVYKDFYSAHTGDDCSIILATDISFDSSKCDERFKAVADRHSITFTERVGEKCIYASKNDKGEYFTVLSSEAVEIPQIDGVKIITPVDTYVENGYYCNVYPYTETPSIEKLYQYGMICEQPENMPSASYLTLNVYEELINCISKLEKNGYELNQASAHTLILYDENCGLMLYPEAIVRKEDGEKYDNKKLFSYFDSLYGKIQSKNFTCPIFKLDYNNIGYAKYLDKDDKKLIGYIVRKNNQLYLVNGGEGEWLDNNDNFVKRNSAIPLVESEHLFKTRSFFGYTTYSFVLKESIKPEED